MRRFQHVQVVVLVDQVELIMRIMRAMYIYIYNYIYICDAPRRGTKTPLNMKRLLGAYLRY